MKDDIIIESDLCRDLEQLAIKYSNADNSHFDYSFDEGDGTLKELINTSDEDDLDGALDLFQSSSVVGTYGRVFEEVKDTKVLIVQEAQNFDVIEDEEGIFNTMDDADSRGGATTAGSDTNISNSNDIWNKVKMLQTSRTGEEDIKIIPRRGNESRTKSMRWMKIESPPIKDYMINSLQAIERETKEEQTFMRNKRREFQRKREILVSKERVTFARLDNAANSLQTVVRSFVARRRSARNNKYRRGFVKMMKVLKYLSLSNALANWIESNVYKRDIERIARWLQWHYRRRQNEFKDRMIFRSKVLRRTIGSKHFHLTQSGFKKLDEFAAAKRNEEKVYRQRSSGAILIQCTVRLYLSRKQLLRLREILRRSSIIKIQSCYRQAVERKFCEFKKAKAAMAIQKKFRGQRIRKRFTEALITRRSYHDDELDDIFENDVDAMIQNILHPDCDDLGLDWQPKIPQTTRCTASGQLLNATTSTNSAIKKTTILRVDRALGNNHERLMDEWNITDNRVIESMLKRMNHMNHIKNRGERSRKLTNPMNRLRKVMRVKKDFK